MHKFTLAPRYVLCEAFVKDAVSLKIGPIEFIDRGCVDTATIAGRPPGVAPAYVMHMHALVSGTFCRNADSSAREIFIIIHKSLCLIKCGSFHVTILSFPKPEDLCCYLQSSPREQPVFKPIYKPKEICTCSTENLPVYHQPACANTSW